MLTEDQINILPERIQQRLQQLQTEYLESIGSVIGKIGELRPTDVHRLQQMYNYGADVQRITQKLAEASGKNISDIYEMFTIVAKENYDYAKPFYKARGRAFIPYADNEELQRYVRSLAEQTAGEYENLTQHTAFAIFTKDKKSIAPLFAPNSSKAATSLSDTYTRVVDYAVTKVQLGTVSYTEAMNEVMRAMVHSGIKTVDYATGYSRRLDTAVRQNVLWGIKQCNQNTADQIGADIGADGYEISYHSNPRPSHAEMGGRQYAIGKARTVNGVNYPSFDDVEPLLEEYGCLHFKFSILLGVSSPAYSREQLEAFKAADKQTFTFEGETYTKYEASQLQRKIEAAVRNQKDLATIAQAAGHDDLRREAQEKINLLTGKYARLSEAAGLPTKMERMRAAGFRSVKAETVDNSGKSGIIKTEVLKRIPQVSSSTITRKIEVGEYGTKLSKQQYQKHIEGTPQYNQYLSTRRAKGGNPQSIITISKQEVQEIILTKSGTGIVRVSRNGTPKPQEDITCDKIIGKYYGGGKYHNTNKATIHYGKQKSHIVPIKGDNYD